jgi:multisubunit Na+/H+ antiporter MnhB subunit
LVIFIVPMFAEFPEFGSPVMDRFADAPSNAYLRDGLENTGAANIVTAVLLDFRAYDTLGEATVLFCAVLGALSVIRPKAKKLPEEADEEGES